MQGMHRQRELTPEEVAASIPPALKEVRELTLALFSSDLAKQWLAKMKQYYIMDYPVAAPNMDDAYARFREGQNSLLRAIETFGAEEAAYNQYMAQQMQVAGRMN